MKRTFAFIWAAALVGADCVSETFPADPRTFPVLVTSDRGTGSGCLLQLSNSVYVVTAKHVLFAEAEGTNPPALLSPEALVRAYSTAGSTNVSERTLLLDLARLLGEGEIRYSTNRDVAIVRIEECLTNDLKVAHSLSGVTFVSPASGLDARSVNYVCSLTNVEVGAEVCMFGYPVSLTGPIREIFEPSEPLLRRGIVAGVNLGRRTLIIDCPSYLGNSGGPVLQVTHPALDVRSFHIIGLVSGFVPFQEEWENKTLRYSHVVKSNSGYTVVEPIDIALDLVWK